MSQNNPVIEINDWINFGSDEDTEWQRTHCRVTMPEIAGGNVFTNRNNPKYLFSATPTTAPPNWADGLPELLSTFLALMVEKRKQEFRYYLQQAALSELERRIQKLESLQTKIIPIDSFVPEPYVVLKPILVAMQPVEGEFEAGWFDANIHSGGDNEEEAVRNLKGQIIDLFESFSAVPSDKLGSGPKRQLLVMRQFIQKNA